MFEPDAEAMPPGQREQLQLGRVRGLVDRLLSLGGVQAGLLRAPPSGGVNLWHG